MKRVMSAVLVLCLLGALGAMPGLAEEEARLPRLQYRSNDYVTYLGKELYLEMKVLSGGTLPAGSVLELRDADGTVWAEKAFNAGAKAIAFRIQMEEKHLGGHTLNVWYGDRKVTGEDLYVAVSDLSRPTVKTVETTEPVMSISLDCGFYGDNTDMVLGVLEEYGVKATFFFTGYFVKNFPEEAERIRDAGHEIGCHSMTHPRLTEQSRTRQMSEIQGASEYIQQQLGVVPTLFRPPYGDVNGAVTALSRAAGMEVIMWSIDSHDWDKSYTADKVFKRVTNKVGPGSIILFHLDGYTCEENLRRALDYYTGTLGLQVIPVGELLEKGGWELPANPYLTEAAPEAGEGQPVAL